MARIVVQRVYATAASLSSVTLKLDGERVGKIKSGSTLAIDTSEGSHQLQAHLLWQTSNPLTVAVSDDSGEVFVELTTSQDVDDPAHLGFLRGWLKPRSAFSLRLIQ